MAALIVIVMLLLLMWIMLIRPQRRKQQEQQDLLSNLQVGDEIVTAGGIYGTVSRLDEDYVTVEIAPSTEVRVSRRAIAGITREPEDEEAEAPEEAEEAENGAAASAEPDLDPNGVNPGAKPSGEGDRG